MTPKRVKSVSFLVIKTFRTLSAEQMLILLFSFPGDFCRIPNSQICRFPNAGKFSKCVSKTKSNRYPKRNPIGELPNSNAAHKKKNSHSQQHTGMSLVALFHYAGTALPYAGTAPIWLGSIRILCRQVAGNAPICWHCAPVCWHHSNMLADGRHKDFMLPGCWRCSSMLAMRSSMLALLHYGDRLAAYEFYAARMLAFLPYAGTALPYDGTAPIC